MKSGKNTKDVLEKNALKLHKVSTVNHSRKKKKCTYKQWQKGRKEARRMRTNGGERIRIKESFATALDMN